MSFKSVSFIAILVVAMTAFGMGMGISWWQQQSIPYPVKAATLWPHLDDIKPFQLQDQDGNRFTQAQLQDKWSLFFFGYTHCPDVCPSTLAMLSTVAERLQKENIQIIFVSVDPERDMPSVMKPYLAYFNPNLIGLTGSQKEIIQLSLQFSLPFARKIGSGADYQMDHSTTLILTSPKAQRYAIFSSPHDADLIAQDLQGLIK